MLGWSFTTKKKKKQVCVSLLPVRVLPVWVSRGPRLGRNAPLRKSSNFFHSLRSLTPLDFLLFLTFILALCLCAWGVPGACLLRGFIGSVEVRLMMRWLVRGPRIGGSLGVGVEG